jgi:hypothetical protein
MRLGPSVRGVDARDALQHLKVGADGQRCDQASALREVSDWPLAAVLPGITRRGPQDSREKP